MTPRLDIMAAAAEPILAMREMSERIHAAGVEKSLAELIKIRASQINGCAFCLDMHSRDARSNGETEDRLDLLAGWREAPCYSTRERAALAWTEALTLIADTHAPDSVYAEFAAAFSPAEQVKVTLLITTINAWNRIAIGFRAVPPLRGRHARAA